MTTLTEVLKYIKKEADSDELVVISQAINEAYKKQRNERIQQVRSRISVGAEVRIAGNIKPAYLRGVKGRVTEVALTKALIQVPPVGRFKTGALWVPLSALEVI